MEWKSVNNNYYRRVCYSSDTFSSYFRISGGQTVRYECDRSPYNLLSIFMIIKIINIILIVIIKYCILINQPHSLNDNIIWLLMSRINIRKVHQNIMITYLFGPWVLLLHRVEFYSVGDMPKTYLTRILNTIFNDLIPVHI